MPVKGSTVQKSPDNVTLVFSEAVELTSLSLQKTGDKAEARSGAAAQEDSVHLMVPLPKLGRRGLRAVVCGAQLRSARDEGNDRVQGRREREMRRAAWALLLLGAAGLAHGKDCIGVDVPERLRLDDADLTLNGAGVRKATFLKVKVYVAALYVARPSREAAPLVDAAAPAVLVLRFVRDVGVDDLTKAWREGFEKTSKARLPALKDRIDKLNGWMRDVKSGQQLKFARRPGAGIEVTVDGATMGTTPGRRLRARLRLDLAG